MVDRPGPSASARYFAAVVHVSLAARLSYATCWIAMVRHHVSGSHVSGPARNSRCFGFAARRFAAVAGAMVLRLSLLVPNNITAIVLVA